MLKLLVIEDHTLVREGLVNLLAQVEDGVVVADRPDFESALALLDDEDEVDLILLDLALPGIDGFAGLDILRRRYPAIPVAVVSAFDDLPTVTRVMNLGASGFIPKSFSGEQLLAAVRQVLAGEIFRPRGAGKGGHLDDAVPLPPSGSGGAGVTPAEIGLTERQAQVLGAAGARPFKSRDRRAPRAFGGYRQDPRDGDPQGARRCQPHPGADRRDALRYRSRRGFLTLAEECPEFGGPHRQRKQVGIVRQGRIPAIVERDDRGARRVGRPHLRGEAGQRNDDQRSVAFGRPATTGCIMAERVVPVHGHFHALPQIAAVADEMDGHAALLRRGRRGQRRGSGPLDQQAEGAAAADCRTQACLYAQGPRQAGDDGETEAQSLLRLARPVPTW